MTDKPKKFPKYFPSIQHHTFHRIYKSPPFNFDRDDADWHMAHRYNCVHQAGDWIWNAHLKPIEKLVLQAVVMLARCDGVFTNQSNENAKIMELCRINGRELDRCFAGLSRQYWIPSFETYDNERKFMYYQLLYPGWLLLRHETAKDENQPMVFHPDSYTEIHYGKDKINRIGTTDHAEQTVARGEVEIEDKKPQLEPEPEEQNKPSSFKEVYLEYLQSEHWFELRNARKVMDNNECQLCASTKYLHVHHRFYRKNHYDTQLEDLITLCSRCHARHHDKPQYRGRRI